MNFSQLLDIVEDQPVFSSALLKAGDVDRVDIASQLSRWVKSGKLLSLRRGVYALAPRYSRRAAHPFEVANLLQRPSYVSLESALSFHGLIPEAVFATTSVTTARPGEFETPLGHFDYRHVSKRMWWGYRLEPLGDGAASALIARPEKALLDLAYLRPRADAVQFIRQLRLQPFGGIDFDELAALAERTGRPKLVRFAQRVVDELTTDVEGWGEL